MAKNTAAAYTVEAWQTVWRDGGAQYYVKMYRNGSYFWGGTNMIRPYLNGEYPYYGWAAPDRGSWKYFSNTDPAVGNYYRLYDSSSGWQNLSWVYFSPQPGYISAKVLEFYRDVTINRGNSRQGSVTVRVGIDSKYSDWRFPDCFVNLTLYTNKIADISNVALNVTIDDKSNNPRYIRVSSSFTNPSTYYTAYLYHNGNLLASGTGSLSRNIEVTYNMFDTNQSFNLVIKGKDGVTYHNSTKTVHVEPSGVGIWVRQSNRANEVFHVYYKNNSGEIIEVTEAWYKRNSQNIKTTK